MGVLYYENACAQDLSFFHSTIEHTQAPSYLVGSSSVPGVEALSITRRASPICTASWLGLARDEYGRGATKASGLIEHIESLILAEGVWCVGVGFGVWAYGRVTSTC